MARRPACSGQQFPSSPENSYRESREGKVKEILPSLFFQPPDLSTHDPEQSFRTVGDLIRIFPAWLPREKSAFCQSQRDDIHAGNFVLRLTA